MSDATGAISGGTSTLMTVGDSTSGKTCNTTLPANDFFFSADNTLTQCQNFAFTQYDGAKLPLTIFAFLPGGSDSFVVPFSPAQAKSFNWKANVTAQAQVAISVIDSQGRGGGTDIMRVVAGSSDKSCLSDTGSSGTTTGGATPTGGSGGSGTDSESKSSFGTGAIAGIAVGAALVSGLLAGLIWWLTRRRSKDPRGPRAIDLAEDMGHNGAEQPMLSAQYQPDPFPPVFVAPGMNASVGSFQPNQQQQHPYPPPGIPRQQSYYDDTTSSSGAGSSASGSRTTKTSNFIVHRDIEEADEPVDLPPQYVDRRAPIPGLAVDSPPPVGARPKKG
ncbi:hypothetical protein V5O48_010302 [Marasmius crinis-equi]|uniref:Uncharacterized protein n=1 Tax=Marasmius crinis-equi TaxID=585013 RepID=A0ABR3F8P3_9AGAR